MPAVSFWLELRSHKVMMVSENSKEVEDKLSTLVYRCTPGSSEHAQVLMIMGSHYMLQGMAGQAGENLRAAAEVADGVGDLHVSGAARSNLGVVLRRAGELEEAEQVTQRAIEDLRRCRNWNECGGAMFSLAQLLQHHGRHEEALALSQEIVEIARTHNHQRLLAFGHSMVGECSHRLKDLDTARSSHEEALDIARRLGITNVETASKVNLGKILLAEERWDEAVENLSHHTKVLTTPYTITRGGMLLAQALYGSKRHSEALDVLLKSQALAKKHTFKVLGFYIQMQLTHIHVALGDAEKATRSLQAAEATLHDVADPDAAVELQAVRDSLHRLSETT